MKKPLLFGESARGQAPLDSKRADSSSGDGYSSSNNSNQSNIEKLRQELHNRVRSQDDDGTRTISAFLSDVLPRENNSFFSSMFSAPTMQPTDADADADESDSPRTDERENRFNRPTKPEPNIIVTGRYNLITFFPQSLFEQFRRLANVYFLILGTIAAIGEYTDLYLTAVDAVGILTPMVTVVLISVIKDGIEDIKRHRADNIINKKKTHIVTKDEEVLPVEWATLIPGNIVLLCNGDELPADIVVIACGGIQGKTCYVETAAIDGETNLKPRLPCIAETVSPLVTASATSNQSMSAHESFSTGIDIKVTATYSKGATDAEEVATRRVTGISTMSLSVLVEHPTEIIDGFNGSVTFSSSVGEGRAVTTTLTRDNLLLRGSVLRASEWCVGMVVYTGKETKISMNSKKAPSKLSSVDRIVNYILVIAIISMLVVCLISMVLGILWNDDNSNADYLCLHSDSLSKPGFNFIGKNGGGCTSPAAESALTVFTFATLYNNFVCISMYVSLEMVYLCQAYFISQDLTIYDPSTDTPAECHSSGMCADLGQIQYVMSDKTGTLTKNMMKLRRVSVAGVKYGEPILLSAPMASMTSAASAAATALSMLEPQDLDGQGRASFGLIPDIRSSLGLLPGYSKASSSHVLSTDGASSVPNAVSRASMNSVTSATTGITNQGNLGPRLSEEPEEVWFPLEQLSSVNSLVTSNPTAPSEWSQRDRTVYDFIRVLVSCNTCIIMPDDQGTTFIDDLKSLKKHLQAESPDEVALVVAAAEFTNTLLVKRDGNVQTICRSDPRSQSNSSGVSSMKNTELTEVLAVNGFDSDRKRMSVLVRLLDPTSGIERYLLLVKGADSTLLPLCHEGLWSMECLDHIESFASTGLRTLVMAHRELTASEAMEWLAEFRTASKSVGKRKENLSACAVNIERNLELLGAVGIEDELQDGVPDAIRMLLLAGLNVWMITGDKPETAIAISHQCGLLSDDHEIEKVLGLSGEALRQRILDLHGYLEGRQSIMGSVDRDAYSFSIVAPDAGDKQARSSSGSSNFGFSNPLGEKYITNVTPSPTNLSVANGVNPLTSAPTATAAVASKKKIALIVDGTSLEALWALPDLKKRFTEAVRSVPTVIACRVSPKQKAALVRMIKTGAGSPITLAIGDGANDVGMIHEARVGVGIAGREGRHAANSSDFAIGQFRFLVPLILEHGRFNYIRCSKLVLYSFFKNLVLVSVLFYFCIYSGYSGTVPLDSIVFSGYNFYLGLPIIALGAFDYDVPRQAVNRYPFLAYSTGRLGEMLNLGTMFRWCLTAFLQGMLLFTVTTRMITGDDTILQKNFNIHMNGPGGLNTASGHPTGLFVFGYMLYTVTVVAMQYKVMVMTTTRTWITWLLWILSFIGYFLFTYVYGLFDSMDWFKVAPMAFQCPTYWLAILLCPLILLLSDICFETGLAKFFPTSQDNLVEVLHLEQLLLKKQQKLEHQQGAAAVLNTLNAGNDDDEEVAVPQGTRASRDRVISDTSTASSWWQDNSSSYSGALRSQVLHDVSSSGAITSSDSSSSLRPSTSLAPSRDSRLSSNAITSTVNAIAATLSGRNSSAGGANGIQVPLLSPASLQEQEDINGVSFGVGDPVSSPSASISTNVSQNDMDGMHMRALHGAVSVPGSGSGGSATPATAADPVVL